LGARTLTGEGSTGERGKARVVLADGHQLMIEAVRLRSKLDGDFEVVGSTHRRDEDRRACPEPTPDVVVLDVRMAAS